MSANPEAPSFLMQTFRKVMPSLPGTGNYQKLSQEDGTVVFDSEAPIALPQDYEDKELGGEEGETLLSGSRKRVGKSRVGGLNWFWKAILGLISVVLLFLLGRFVYGLITGRSNSTPNDGRPIYGESLGCDSAPYIYNSSSFSMFSPMGSQGNNHVVDVKGLGVGTISLAKGHDDLKEVMYEVTIRSNDEERLNDIHFTQPHITDDAGNILTSRLLINTGLVKPESEDSCVRFDLVLYIPPSMGRLNLLSHAATTHVRFDPDLDMEIAQSFFVTLYSKSPQNLITPHERLHAPTMSLEVFNGWIVGDVLAQEDTKIKTQRGPGVANVRVHASGTPDDTSATFYSVTGAGDTTIEYVGGSNRRAMRNVHLSTDPHSKMYLKYSDSGYNGRIEMGPTDYEATTIQPLSPTKHLLEHEDSVMHRVWSHYYNDANGPDELSIDSRGWASLTM